MENEQVFIGEVDLAGKEADLLCTFDPTNYDIVDFILFIKGHGDIVVDQGAMYDTLLDLFNNDNTEGLIRDHVMGVEYDEPLTLGNTGYFVWAWEAPKSPALQRNRRVEYDEPLTLGNTGCFVWPGGNSGGSGTTKVLTEKGESR